MSTRKAVRYSVDIALSLQLYDSKTSNNVKIVTLNSNTVDLLSYTVNQQQGVQRVQQALVKSLLFD